MALLKSHSKKLKISSNMTFKKIVFLQIRQFKISHIFDKVLSVFPSIQKDKLVFLYFVHHHAVFIRFEKPNTIFLVIWTRVMRRTQQ